MTIFTSQIRKAGLFGLLLGCLSLFGSASCDVSYMLNVLDQTEQDIVGGVAVDATGDVYWVSATDEITKQPGKGEIREVVIYDTNKQAKAMMLYLFDSVPSTIADNAAFALNAADVRKLVGGPVYLASHSSCGTTGITYAAQLSKPFRTDGDSKLYGYLVCSAAPTYSATDAIDVGLSIVEDID